MKISIFIVAISPFLITQVSQAQILGPRYEVDVRGLMMSCTAHSGLPVEIYLNYQLNDVGVASINNNGTPTITINPKVTKGYSDIVTKWWFAHECAHHALPPVLNNESNADCYGVKQLVKFGILNNQYQLNAFRLELASLPGSPMGHLPGPIRAKNIAMCALK